MEPEEFFKKHFTHDYINLHAGAFVSHRVIYNAMQQYASEEKRTEAIEFGYGCAFLIDECPSIEGVADVYDIWNEKTSDD